MALMIQAIFLWHIFGLIDSSIGQTYLRFIPVIKPEDVHEFFDIPSKFENVEVDASSPFQTKVRIVEHLDTPPTLKLHCRVAKLENGATLTHSSLCRKLQVSSPEVCLSTESVRLKFEQIEFHAMGDNSQGNGNGKLESNMVEIQDIGYYHREMAKRGTRGVNFLPTLTTASLPMQLDCGDSQNSEHLPVWADTSFPSPFQWSLCSFNRGENHYDCLLKVRKTFLPVSQYLHNTVMPNGSLILLERASASWSPLALICFSFAYPSKLLSIYYGGSEDNFKEINFNDTARYPQNRGIRPLSPVEQSLTVDRGTWDFQLTAVYQANPDTTDYEWRKDGVRIPPDFISRSRFILGFPKPVNRNHSGVYTLTLSDRWTKDSLTMKYTVTIVGPPFVRRPSPSRVVVVEGARLSFSCELVNQHTVRLEINGIEVSPSADSQELLQQFPYLKEVQIHPLQISGPVIQYTVGNLFFRPGFPLGPSHMVTIIGVNPHGILRLPTEITVLRKPNLLTAPKNCTADRCFSNARQHFICEFDMEPYRSSLDVVQVNQTWELDDTDILSLKENRAAQADYLEVSGNQFLIPFVFTPPDASTSTLKLALKPVAGVHVPLFRDNRITCRLRIYVIKNPSQPSRSIVRPVSRSVGASSGYDLIYDSKVDANLKGELTVTVQLKLVDEPSKGNISWIAAVLIAALILIVVAALIAFVVMRNRGQTYSLDREERALGNDPVKEYHEKEGFRTYERADEPPLCGSRYSGNDGSAEIGSDADGELDGYSIDPGKFNEDGSFIDQYATDTPYKNHARLPLLSRDYDHPHA